MFSLHEGFRRQGVPLLGGSRFRVGGPGLRVFGVLSAGGRGGGLLLWELPHKNMHRVPAQPQTLNPKR